MNSRFARDTGVKPLGEGLYEGCIDPGWWIVRGPNGGYLAAILLRALAHAVGDSERRPRSLTVHYLRPPIAGPIELHTSIEREGRSLTTLSVRMLQEGRLQCLALAAFSKARDSLAFQHAQMPAVPAPEEIEPVQREASIPLRERYEERWAIGARPWEGGPKALAGGWIRLSDPHPVDAPLVAAVTDAWPPALFSHLQVGALMGGVPTVDLTIHFRAPLPPPGARPHEWLLVTFRSREARDGFVEEDGEIWSRDGVLLAQSRQLAVVV